MPEPLNPPEFWQIIEAARRLSDHHIRKTPLWDSPSLKQETRARAVKLKLENLQRTGSFKVRGAINKLHHLSQDERRAGVIVASPGNLAQGVALAAKSLHIPCTVVMPHGMPLRTKHALADYGVNSIIEFGTTLEEALKHAQELANQHGFTCVPAFDDTLMIAGHGTVGKEITDEWQDVDAIIIPVGSGGLISGIAIAAKEVSPNTQIIGVRVDKHYAIAEGINTRHPGELASTIMNTHVDRWATVSDQDIARSVIWLLERQKYLVEGAGAVGVAAMQRDSQLKDDLRDKNVAVVISGGNTDISEVGHLLEYVFAAEGRVMTFDVNLPDRPADLKALITEIADHPGVLHIREVIKQQASPSLTQPRARVTAVLEVVPGKGRDLLAHLKRKRYSITHRPVHEVRNNHEGERADISDPGEEAGQTASSS